MQDGLREGQRDEHECELEDHEEEHDAEAEIGIPLGQRQKTRPGNPDQQECEHVHPGEREDEIE